MPRQNMLRPLDVVRKQTWFQHTVTTCCGCKVVCVCVCVNSRRPASHTVREAFLLFISLIHPFQTTGGNYARIFFFFFFFFFTLVLNVHSRLLSRLHNLL